MEKRFGAYAGYMAGVKRVGRFGLPPVYEESGSTSLSPSVFVHEVVEVFGELGWNVVYQDDRCAEAKRPNGRGRWTEKVSVALDGGVVSAKSRSLGRGVYDFGRNSLRVKLLLHVLALREERLGVAEREAIEQAVERERSWADYRIPSWLPAPPSTLPSKPLLPLLGGLAFALVAALVLGYISLSDYYVLGLMEWLVGLGLGLTVGRCIRPSNFLNLYGLRGMVTASVVAVYLGRLYVGYRLVLGGAPVSEFGFGEYMDMLLEGGLVIRSLHLGTLGLLLSWVFQLVFTQYIAMSYVESRRMDRYLELVPEEVLDLVLYLMHREMDEGGIRAELSRLGWSERGDQDLALGAVSVMQEVMEAMREG